MDPLRLNRKDGLFIAVCLVVLAAGIVVGLKYFQKAFPEASIDFRYNRSQTETIAARYLTSLNLSPPHNFLHAGLFSYDGQAKTYLEKELGVEGARKYLGHPIRLWYWEHRWFRPSTKEEFKVYVTPEGDVVYLRHEVEEKAAGADLAEADARVLAERFLFGTMKQDSAGLGFLQAQRTGRPNRSDWTFTWRARGVEPVKGSEYRYEVTVIGDRAGGYREFLHVPEAWQQSFGRLRSFNEMAGNFSGVGLLLTAIAMLAVFVIRTRRRVIAWRTSIAFGIVAAALILLNQINDLPLELYFYDTTTSWPGFIVRTILMNLLGSLAQGVLIFLLTAAAETVYRERYGSHLSLPKMFTPRGLGTKTAFKNLLLGVTLTSFFFAYQIVFYLVANRLGAWSPSEVPYDNLLNTAMPWLAVLFIGFFPAVTEEFISRGFSIPFLQKAFRNRLTWLALLIPAFIWGFGHSTYPNEPFYIRGLEVGLAGVVIGIVMLKFGILACLVWHYTVDAMYTAMLLFRSHNAYFILTAAVATGLLAIPLIVAFLAYLRRGRFAPEQGTLNADIAAVAPPEPVAPVPVPVSVEPAATVYSTIGSRRRILAVAILAAGVVAALVPVKRIGDFLSYPISKDQAIRLVADSLRAVGWANPDTLKIAAFIRETGDESPSSSLVYLLKHTGSVEKFNRITDERLGEGRWKVLVWKPENRLRYMGTVHARSGRIESLYALLPEEMPGDSLTQDSARSLIAGVLTKRGEDLSKLNEKDYRQYTRPKRIDQSFTWEARDGDPRNVAEAKYRRSGSVNGRYLSVGNRPWYKIPEAWERERQATTALRAVRQWLHYVVIGGIVVWAAVMLIARTRRGLVPWKKALLLSIVPGVVALLVALNQLYLGQEEYFNNIEVPWGVFQTGQIVAVVTSFIVGYLLFALGLALLGGLYSDRLHELRRDERRAAVLDGMLVAAAGAGVLLLLRSIEAWLTASLSGWVAFAGWQVPDWMAGPLPLLDLVGRALARMLMITVLVSFFAYLWTGPMRKPIFRTALIVAGVLFLLPSAAVDSYEWAFACLMGLVTVVAIWASVRFLVAGRAVLMICMVAGYVLFRYAADAIQLGNASVTLQGWVFVVLAVVALVIWLQHSGGKRRAGA
jgi:membrane protease YdiL (CAAX protease family)